MEEGNPVDYFPINTSTVVMFGNQKHGLNLVNCALRWSPEPVNISEDFRYDHSVVSIFYAIKMISLLVLCI